jgi:hypothetical protein
MHPEGRRKCLHCQKFFVPDPRNRGHQRYCGKPKCREASKRASQRRWRGRPENAEYFRGPSEVARVQAWRRAHPGYWRRRKRKDGDALQDLLITQSSEGQPDPKQDGGIALQDHWQRQPPVLIGLIAHLTGSALQEDIASMTGRLIAKGQALMGQKPSDDSEKNLVRGAAAAGTAGL